MSKTHWPSWAPPPAGPGSRCDIYRQRCTLPFRERKVRPIVWYYTVDSDLEYYGETSIITSGGTKPCTIEYELRNNQNWYRSILEL